MRTLSYLAYAFHLSVIVCGALAAVRAARLERALLGLIATMFGVAGMYLLMNAPYLALMQLLIYVGAVGVLIFFAVMLTRPAVENPGPGPRPLRRKAWGLAAGLLAPLALALGAFRFFVQVKAQAPEVGAAELGAGFLGRYALAFELISVVLFAAMAGVVLLGFERRRGR